MKTLTILSIFILTLTQVLASSFPGDLRDSASIKDPSKRTSTRLDNPWLDLENKIYLILKPIMRKAHPHREMGETVMAFLDTLNASKSTPMAEDAAPVLADKDKDLGAFASLLNLFQVVKHIEKFDPNCPKSVKSAEAILNPKNIKGFTDHLKNDQTHQDQIFQKLIEAKVIPAVPDDHIAVAGNFYQTSYPSTAPKFNSGQMQMPNKSTKHPQYDLVGKVIQESLTTFDQALNTAFEDQIPKHIFYTPLEFLRLQLFIHWTGLNHQQRTEESFNFYLYPAAHGRYQRIPGEIPPATADLPDDLFKFHRLEKQELPKDLTWKMTKMVAFSGISTHVNQDMDKALRVRVTSLQKYLETKASTPVNDNQSPEILLREYLDAMQVSYGLQFDLNGNPLGDGSDGFFANLKADFDESYSLKQKIDQEAYRLGTLLKEKHMDFLNQQALTTWFFNPVR